MSQRSKFIVQQATVHNSTKPNLSSSKRTSVKDQENVKKKKVSHSISDEKPVQSHPMSDISNLPFEQARDECRVSVPIPNETLSTFTDKSSLINSIPNLNGAFPKKPKKKLFNFEAKDNPHKSFVADLEMLDSITYNENFDGDLDKLIAKKRIETVTSETGDEISSSSGPALHDVSGKLNDSQEKNFVDVNIDPISSSNEAPLINRIPIIFGKESVQKSPLVDNIPNQGSGKDNSLKVIGTGHSSGNESVLISATEVHTSNGVFASSTPQKDASTNLSVGTEVEKPMKKILESSQKGRRVLNYFQSHLKLNSAKRALLCGVLIDHAINDDPNVKLNAKDFHRLAALIVDFFPKEKTETYYVPFVPKTGHRKRKLASGKLWHKYTNTCKELRDDGLRAFQSSNSEEGASLTIDYNFDDVNIDDYNDAVAWLGKSTTPWQTVINKWRLTAPGKLLQFDKSDISIEDYFAEFPALKVSEAGDLIRIDFSVKFPGSEQVFIDKWPTLVFSILQYVAEKAKEDRSFAKSIETQDLPSTFDEEEVKRNPKKWNLLAVRLLLHIIPLRSAPNRKKKTDTLTNDKVTDETVRLSKIEVAKRFFMIIPSSTTFVTDIKNRVALYTQIKKRCQTFIVLVGEEPDYSYFVYFQDILYTVDDLVSAIDLSFKIYMVLNAEYPPENMLVWLLVQEFIYKLHTEHDEVYLSSLTTLASDLELV